MKVGDMVRVSFGTHEDSVIGVFISDDTVSCGENKDGDIITTRANVLWEGQVYSTPIDQLEVISAADR